MLCNNICRPFRSSVRLSSGPNFRRAMFPYTLVAGCVPCCRKRESERGGERGRGCCILVQRNMQLFLFLLLFLYIMFMLMIIIIVMGRTLSLLVNCCCCCCCCSFLLQLPLLLLRFSHLHATHFPFPLFFLHFSLLFSCFSIFVFFCHNNYRKLKENCVSGRGVNALPLPPSLPPFSQLPRNTHTVRGKKIDRERERGNFESSSHSIF